MKRALLVAILLLAARASSQPLTFHRLGGPASSATNLCVGSNGELVALIGATVAYSVDAGLTWHVSLSPIPSGSLYSNKFFLALAADGSVIAACQMSTEDTTVDGIYRSSDHGNSWRRVLPSYYISGLFASPNGNLYAFGSVDPRSAVRSVIVSTDAGRSWVVLNVFYFPTSLHFDASGNIYSLGTTVDQVIKSDPLFTVQRGILPNGLPPYFGQRAAKQVFAFGSNEVFLLGDTTIFGLIGDSNWVRLGTIPDRNVLDFVRTDDGTFWIESYQHVLWRSLDHGTSWDTVALDPLHVSRPFELTRDDQNGLYLNSLVVTRDGGAHWNAVGMAMANIASIAATANGTIFVNQGELQRSSDGGAHWTRVYVNNDSTLRPYGFLGQGPRGTIVVPVRLESTGDQMHVWIYDDTAGGTWSNMGVVSGGLAGFIATDHKDNMYVTTGYVQGVFRSNDGAVTWELASLPNTGKNYTCIAFGPANTTYIGSSPSVYMSTDDGVTWKSINHQIANTTITVISCPVEGTVVIGTLDKGFFRSTDSGATWTQWGSLAEQATALLGYEDGTVIAGTTGGLYSSSLASNIWTKRLFQDEDVSVNTVLRYGENNILVGTTTGIWEGSYPLDVHREDVSAPLVTIFPNPCNTAGHIDLQLAGPEHVRVEVFDLLGRSVALLSDRTLGQDGSAIAFDCSQWAEGTYVVLLQIGEKRITRLLNVVH